MKGHVVALAMLVVAAVATPTRKEPLEMEERALIKKVLDLLEERNAESQQMTSSFFDAEEDEVTRRGVFEKRGHGQGIKIPQGCLDDMSPITINLGRLVGYFHRNPYITEARFDKVCTDYEANIINITKIDADCIAPSKEDWENSTRYSPKEIESIVAGHEAYMKKMRKRARVAKDIFEYACTKNGREVMKEMRNSACARTKRPVEVKKNCTALPGDLAEATCDQFRVRAMCVIHDMNEECGEAYGKFYNATYPSVIAAAVEVEGKLCEVDAVEPSTPPALKREEPDLDLLITQLTRALEKRTECPDDVNPQDCRAAKEYGQCNKDSWAWTGCQTTCNSCGK